MDNRNPKESFDGIDIYECRQIQGSLGFKTVPRNLKLGDEKFLSRGNHIANTVKP